MRETPEEKLTQFREILQDENLINLGKEFGIEDQRHRKITLSVFFWLMVFACTMSETTGCLAALCAQFATAFCHLFAGQNPTTITKAAISKKTKKTNWLFFKDVFNRLLMRYQRILPASTIEKFKQFSDIKAIDSTVIQVCKKLESIFQSTREGIATIKIHTSLSLLGQAPDKINVTEGKRGDRQFKFQEALRKILYIFDLGYYSHELFDRLISRGCFFVSRLKFVCSLIVIKALDRLSPRNIAGFTLEQICQRATHGTLDLLIELGKVETSRMRHQVRLIGVLHDHDWYFYITNIFDRSLTPLDFYLLYAQRWQIEILFNQIKTYLSLDNIFCRTKNGIMIQVYSAFIFYILCQILVLLAAEKTNRKVRDFSIKAVIEHVGSYLKSIHSLLSVFHLTDWDTFWRTLLRLVCCIPTRNYQSKAQFY